jgi:hypothetical protein
MHRKAASMPQQPAEEADEQPGDDRKIEPTKIKPKSRWFFN